MKVRLGDDARQYVLEEIGFNKTLASLLHERASTNPSEVCALVPDDAVFQERDKFSSGLGTSMSSARDLLTDFVLQEIASLRDGIALFVDIVSESSDPIMSKLSCAFLSLGEEVYYLVAPKETRSDVAGKLQCACGMWTVGCISTASPTLLERMASNLDVDSIRSISTTAQFIILGAFDGEGFIVMAFS